MKNIFLLTIVASTLLMTVACSDDTTSTVVPQKAVVEAYLSPNKTIDVAISKELPFSDTTTTVQKLNNLTVKVEYDGKTITLKSNGDGHYLSNVKVDSNKTYHLFFDYGGKTVEAITTIPAKPTGFKQSVSEIKITAFNPGSGSFPTSPDPVKLTWNNPTNDYFLVVTANTETAPETINSGFGGGGAPPNRIFRNRPSATNTSEIRSMQFQYYGNHDLILYRINAEYASLYDENGSNSLNLTAPFTNVKNGLGIFTGVAADTLKLYVRKG
jgi:Domain of unknown function (DUF4249)